MVDIHNHILFGVDDGAKTLEQSIQMLKSAVEQGISVVCCTPHVHEMTTETDVENFYRTLDTLLEEIEKQSIKIELVLACEIMFHPAIVEVARKKFGTFNAQKKYLLTEFPSFDFPKVTGEIVYELSQEGITTIIAHPERNGKIASNLNEALNLIKYGALLQMDFGSILGDFGKTTKKVCDELLSYDAYTFAASDAHNTSSRNFLMQKGYQEISKIKGTEIADLLCKTNPGKVINGEKIDNDEIWRNLEDKINKPKGNALLSRIFGFFN
ncbi:hypothetical protein IT568_08255 [bacterium]|nr:hypothetical protein [bacterium]